MKIDRFKKRRQDLARRHKCTRCGTGTPKPGCRLCADCLGVLAAKRAINEDPGTRERKRKRAEEQRQLVRSALAKIERRFLEAV